MTRFSAPYSSDIVRHGDVFKMRKFPRQAFSDLSDPIIQVDWFEMTGPTFPPHPHAGISAVTYLFSDSPNGFINHDSMGNTCQILPGSMHWSRASRGLIHEEFPIPDGGSVRGLQIFVNIPSKHQLDPPNAFHVNGDDMEMSSGEGWESRVAVNGRTLEGNPEALPSPIMIEEMHITKDIKRAINLKAGWGGLMIAIEGSFTVDGKQHVNEYEAMAISADADQEITLRGTSEKSRIVVLVGQRTNQPVFQNGPMMMASPELLHGRIESLNRGEFGDIKK